ncbi:MAG: ATP-binding cassette domain-containing protein [Gammaproteobacteria bacterium]|nr:MAG: ATP-binding cassette domain-containing protein [Gammaproteobacteria bacterium]
MNDQGTERERVIEVRGLTMRFGSKTVHENVDFDILRGEVVAIVGGSGSGKSTLLREMTMLQRPTAGTIRLFGQAVDRLDERQRLALRRRFGILFQNGALFGGETVLENIATPLLEHTRLERTLVDELAAIKLRLSGLAVEDGQLYPSQLSGGMRKRAALARAMALDPELLFLDEPTSGLDPISADALDELVLELKAALGPTIVLVTHDMDSLWRIADRVMLLGEGRLLAVGTMAALARSTDPAVARFFNGPRGRAAMMAAGAS